MNFYEFHQNNPRGSCIDLTVGGVTSHHFWVAADNATDANKIFSINIGFDHSFCPCCGERFSEKWDDEEPDFEGSVDDLILHQRNREFFSEFQKNCAVILDPLGKNVVKIDSIVGRPFRLGKFREPIKSLFDGVPEEKDFYFLDGKLYDWDWDHTKTKVIAEMKSAVEAVEYLMNLEYAPGEYALKIDTLTYYAKDYDRQNS